MDKYQRGDRVVYVDTGKKGTVNSQFRDGSVSLRFEDGTYGELPNDLLQKEHSHGKPSQNGQRS
jgi:hypothetical protein